MPNSALKTAFDFGKEVDKIIKLRKKKWSYKQIGDKYHVADTTISRNLVKYYKANPKKKTKKKKISKTKTARKPVTGKIPKTKIIPTKKTKLKLDEDTYRSLLHGIVNNKGNYGPKELTANVSLCRELRTYLDKTDKLDTSAMDEETEKDTIDTMYEIWEELRVEKELEKAKLQKAHPSDSA